MKFKEFMKNLFTKNIVLKLCAICFAVVVTIIIGAASV